MSNLAIPAVGGRLPNMSLHYMLTQSRSCASKALAKTWQKADLYSAIKKIEISLELEKTRIRSYDLQFQVSRTNHSATYAWLVTNISQK